jgi:hypothetical protein
MGVRTFPSALAWTCTCGHTADDGEVVHHLGRNRLSGLVHSRYDDTAEVLRELVGRLGFSSSREGRYSRLAPRTPNRPQACQNSIATCAPAPAKCSPMSRSSILPLHRTLVPLLHLWPRCRSLGR